MLNLCKFSSRELGEMLHGTKVFGNIGNLINDRDETIDLKEKQSRQSEKLKMELESSSQELIDAYTKQLEVSNTAGPRSIRVGYGSKNQKRKLGSILG